MATHSNILAGECHGQRSLLGYSPRGSKELDMTEQLSACIYTHTHTHGVSGPPYTYSVIVSSLPP